MPDLRPAEKLFKQFCESYKNRELQKLLALFANDIQMWGTGIDEYRKGLQEVELQLKRDWSQAEKSEIHIVNFLPTPENALWAAALCQAKITVNHQEYIFDDLRGTIYVDLEDEQWKISHMHASFPDYRNAEQSSFPLNNG